MPSGTVTQFDAHVGLGHVDADDGERYLFHCAEIADGTRAIEVGARVDFDLMTKLGSPEASRLRPAGEPPDPAFVHQRSAGQRPLNKRAADR